MRRALPLLVLLGTGAALPATAQEATKHPTRSPTTTSPRPAPAPGEARAGQPSPSDRELSAEDREVVENLELLESLDATEDLEVLIELSQDDD